jgi:hypothetical protein
MTEDTVTRMKITDTMPFAAELLSPTYEECFRRAGAGAGEGDVALGPDWSVTAGGADRLVRVAADHLRQFLARSVGVQLACCGAEKRVSLSVDPNLDASPEAHLIRVGPGAVEVIGAGAPGVLQGVFRLENRMRERGGPFLALGEEKRTPLFRRRIHRSPLSPFYVEELTGERGDPFNAEWFSPGMAYPAFAEEDAGPDTFYHDNILMRLAEHGFNGVWIRGAFRHFARCSAFPEFGANSDVILSRLRALCERAAGYGISVFLYLNEPLGIADSDPFFASHPEARGAPSVFKPMVNLCTSTPQVQAYLRESACDILTRVPQLAGFIMITASEYPSHCWSHTGFNPQEPQERVGEVAACPRCRERTPQEVVGELVRLVRDGARSAKPEAEIIAWNWSWGMWEPDPQRGVLEALPEDVIIMGDYERGEPTEALGFAYTNDEYSIKVVGPSQRFKGVAEFLKERGRPVYAKLQIGTTHENPDIPYLPALPNIARKYCTLRETGVTGMMTCWNFGNMPSLATEVAGEFGWGPQPDVGAGLRNVAVRNFGPDAADDVVRAWEMLSAAHEAFPSSIPVMYNGPLSRGPAFLFMFDRVDKPFPNSWLLDKDIKGDRLDWAAPFGPEKVLECYRWEAEKGGEALAVMEQALAKTSGEDRRRLERELGVARFHIIQTTSAANVVEFLLLRNAYYGADDQETKSALLDRIEAICRREYENAERSLPLMDADPRLGWHGEAYGYMISRPLVEDKLRRLRELLEEKLPAERAGMR